MNISKLAITTLVTASVFVACSKDDDPAEYTTQYTANTGNLKSAGNAVDLGLPSGTKWADRNVGASSESDNGILFVWGDVTGTKLASDASAYSANPMSAEKLFEMYKGEQKVGYLYDTTTVYKINIEAAVSEAEEAKLKLDSIFNSYKGQSKGRLDSVYTRGDQFAFVVRAIDSTAVKYYVASAGNKFNKAKGDDGVEREIFAGADVTAPVDYLTGNASFDAATANWGSNWAMPTKEQMQELIDNCTWEFTGNGYKVTTKSQDPKVKGNSIFLPAAGFRSGSTWIGNGNAGYYASGAILGSYHFPSMVEQKDGSFGAINSKDATPNMLIFQHGQFDNSVLIYNNLTSNYGLSVRPVAK